MNATDPQIWSFDRHRALLNQVESCLRFGASFEVIIIQTSLSFTCMLEYIGLLVDYRLIELIHVRTRVT